MVIEKIIELIDVVTISKDALITQLKNKEDNEPYQVWIIDDGKNKYVLKEAKGREKELYQSILFKLKESIPTLYQTITIDEKVYLLLEYIDGDDLCMCNRRKLTNALDALISLQQKTWEIEEINQYESTFDKSYLQRQNRGKYLNDTLLEEAYEKFLKVFLSVPRSLCHDDLLPFNVISNNEKAALIDWECGGILPYPTSFARLIAHTEDNENALFYMKESDKCYAINYYYEKLLKEKGISYADWLDTLEYFLYYEYCEWIYVGNKYNVTDGKYFKKYLPIAKLQANKILGLKKIPFQL